MTDQEKQRIAVMRSLGESYNEIAGRLNLSVNTVKTFCRRNQLTGVRASISEHEEGSIAPATQCLLSATNDGNSTDAETAEGKRTRASAGRRDFKVTLEFSDEDDETAVTDIIQMLLRGR